MSQPHQATPQAPLITTHLRHGTTVAHRSDRQTSRSPEYHMQSPLWKLYAWAEPFGSHSRLDIRHTPKVAFGSTQESDAAFASASWASACPRKRTRHVFGDRQALQHVVGYNPLVRCIPNHVLQAHWLLSLAIEFHSVRSAPGRC